MELHIRGVSKTYPNGVQALKDVTLTLPAGMYGLDAAPGPGFEPTQPDLEDVYFSTMAGHIGRRREQPGGTP